MGLHNICKKKFWRPKLLNFEVWVSNSNRILKFMVTITYIHPAQLVSQSGHHAPWVIVFLSQC